MVLDLRQKLKIGDGVGAQPSGKGRGKIVKGLIRRGVDRVAVFVERGQAVPGTQRLNDVNLQFGIGPENLGWVREARGQLRAGLREGQP